MAAAARGEAPLDVGGRRQLFIDRRFIARSEGIELRMNQAQKLGPILDGEGKRIFGHVSQVLEEHGTIRLYVGADRVTIYESGDGQHFRNTEISIGGGGFTTVFPDPHESDPARKYKHFWQRLSQPHDPAQDGLYAGYSADGANFTEVGRVLPYYPDNPPVLNWDARIGKYVVYIRAFDYTSENQRRIGRFELDDLLQPWPYTAPGEERLFLNMESVPVVLSTDGEDNPHSDFYYNAATIYPWAQDAYFMFLVPFRHFSRERNPAIQLPQSGQWEDFGFLEVQVAVSRDGVTWNRPSREPYFPAGLADEWDRWYTVIGPGMVRRGNYLYQYYTASGRTHDSAILRPEYVNSEVELGGIGVVRQRLDGFISADADHRGGWLETPPIVFDGARLRLNIDTGGMGTAFVELRDAEGKALPGFALADCEEIGGNFIDQTVYWNGNADVSSLAGQPIRIYVHLERGKLYAFEFTKE
ncbi:MAG: hypothetical protein HYV27_25490 [Candidatus Hydrogenedentes bacterium]|nr:hypothetical protein [Candidatus Hydrogenedentota bacterium]